MRHLPIFSYCIIVQKSKKKNLFNYFIEINRSKRILDNSSIQLSQKQSTGFIKFIFLTFFGIVFPKWILWYINLKLIIYGCIKYNNGQAKLAKKEQCTANKYGHRRLLCRRTKLKP